MPEKKDYGEHVENQLLLWNENVMADNTLTREADTICQGLRVTGEEGVIIQGLITLVSLH
jgi:hypothetical protein